MYNWKTLKQLNDSQTKDVKVPDKFKFSIENMRKSSSTSNAYGTFDLLVRAFNDTDEEPRVLESFRGLSLDVASDRYIGRVIGDQHVYFNFDVAKTSQKLIVEGKMTVVHLLLQLQFNRWLSFQFRIGKQSLWVQD